MKRIPISTKQLRQEFPRIRKSLEKGNRYVLIHRSKPVAELVPLIPETPSLSEALSFFSEPPKSVVIRSTSSSVKLVKKDRN